MKNLVKMPFFRLALLVLAVVILGLVMKKYVVNHEKFNSPFKGSFLPIFNDGSFELKDESEWRDISTNTISSNNNKKLVCNRCFHYKENEEDKFKYQVVDKVGFNDTNITSTIRDIGCPEYCKYNYVKRDKNGNLILDGGWWEGGG